MSTVLRHLKWRARIIATNEVARFENHGSTEPSALAYVVLYRYVAAIDTVFVLAGAGGWFYETNQAIAPVLPA